MYSVVVCDLFHGVDPDHQVVVSGFATEEDAVAYARRRVRQGIAELRRPGDTREALRDRWRSFGEDCWVSGPDGPGYRASSELDAFLDAAITPERSEPSGPG